MGPGGNLAGPGGNRPGLGGNPFNPGGPRPGIGGNLAGPGRPGGSFPGPGGNRPGLGANINGPGGNRPNLGGNLAGPGRPGGNFPGAGGNRPGLGGNGFAGGPRPGFGGNGFAGRPNQGANFGPGRGGNGPGRNFVNNNVNNINNINNINNNSAFNGGPGYNRGYNGYGGPGRGWGNGGYGGHGRGWGYGGGGYGGGYRGPGNWHQPYYGNWYRGNWGAGSFLTGFGLGALSSFGLSTLSGYGFGGYGFGGGYGYGGYGYGSPYVYSSYGAYNYFPGWGLGNYASWGIGSVANDWAYASYSNPYYVAQAAPSTTVVYDYSQPLNVAATPPEATVVEDTETTFASARDSFKAGDYARALSLADQVLKQTPNVPVVHEFRALTLFALGRFDEAAGVEYAVLSAGPGWDWPTLVGLYPNVDTYTNHLRALEAFARSNPTSAAAQFLLADHYLVQGHTDAARAQFEKVAALRPDDTLTASFVKALTKAAEPAPAAPPSPTAETPPPPPPPAEFNGTWKSNPTADVTITLTLKEGGGFVWEVDNKGQKQTISGTASYQDDTIALGQAEGPPLVGKITKEGPDRFRFAPPGGPADGSAGLTFSR